MNKAYLLTSDAVEWGALVYAPTRNAARSLGLEDCEYIEVRAIREPRADKWANEGGRYEEMPARLRELGWRAEEGSMACACCGLYDHSYGMQKPWIVCDDCEQCGECGHTEACTHSIARTILGVFIADQLDEKYLVECARLAAWNRRTQWRRNLNPVPKMTLADISLLQDIRT